MNKQEYAVYLASLVQGDEFYINRESLEDSFYGYFQGFMPEGKHLEKVFEPIPNGTLLLQRILPVYQLTKEKFEREAKLGISSAYFSPMPMGNAKQLQALGAQYLENLKMFSQFMQNQELEKHLQTVQNIVVKDIFVETQSELDESVYDAISTWLAGNINQDNLISVLSEAYYSISCDYFLSAYLQYPVLQNKPEQDFLHSYFEIWKRGYTCRFGENEMIIVRNKSVTSSDADTINTIIQNFQPSQWESDNVTLLYELTDRLYGAEHPQDFVEPLFGLIERYPDMEAGTPFPIVHFLEKQNYEDALLQSLQRKPTMTSLLMLNRILNVTKEQEKSDHLMQLLLQVAENPNYNEKLRKEARDFYDYQQDKNE